MTRINVGVDPSELNTKMLIAEHREIKRIPNCIKSGRYSMENQPKSFTLGIGHVKFFYDKILYLRNRYKRIHSECVRRGFDVQNFGDSFANIPERLMNDYIETESDRKMILERIALRLKKE